MKTFYLFIFANRPDGRTTPPTKAELAAINAYVRKHYSRSNVFAAYLMPCHIGKPFHLFVNEVKEWSNYRNDLSLLSEAFPNLSFCLSILQEEHYRFLCMFEQGKDMLPKFDK